MPLAFFKRTKYTELSREKSGKISQHAEQSQRERACFFQSAWATAWELPVVINVGAVSQILLHTVCAPAHTDTTMRGQSMEIHFSSFKG